MKYYLCCVGMCVSAEESPSSSEKVQDCDVLLEPTLLGPLRGDGSTVSFSQSLSDAFLLPACHFFSGSDFSCFLFSTSFPF